MTTPTPETTAAGLTSDTRLGRWPAVLGAVLTLAMIGGLIHHLAGSGLAGFARAVPTSPGFYLFFALLYITPQVGDYIIFRRLWDMPPVGLAALTGKRIANDVLFGYAGDAWFYAWARARARQVRSPFGAVKDVGITSAMAGNIFTLSALALALPAALPLLTPAQVKGVLASAAFVVATSLPFFVFRRKVFTLSRGELFWMFGVHLARLLASSLFLTLAWICEMPGQAIGTWLMLAAARMLVSRLPLIPNKDLVFANVAILLIGQGQALSDLVAFTAALTLAVHAVGLVIYGGLRLWGRIRAA
jgi:hypothetical protein